MTRTKPAEQRRADLLAAGQALFGAKGVAGTSLDDITQRAGVSKGLFYLYFAAKEDLVLALREQISRDLAERMRAAAEAVPAGPGPARTGTATGETGWADRLDACVRAGLEGYRDLHDLHEVLFHHPHAAAQGGGDPGSGKPASVISGAGPGSPDPAPAPAARVIRELLEAGVAAGAFDVPDPESTAVLCYASMHAFGHDVRGRPGPDDTRLIRAAQQLFRRAAGLP
jgi:TetR/AcrR family transcriptional regulator, transcriptional repressor for nem operon